MAVYLLCAWAAAATRTFSVGRALPGRRHCRGSAAHAVHHEIVPGVPATASGSLYGTWTSLATLSVPSTMFLMIVLSVATARPEGLAACVGAGLGMAVVCRMMVSVVRVSVNQAGISVFLPVGSVSTTWDNVARLKAGRWGASVVLIEPVRMNFRRTKRLPIAVFDRGWRRRPVGRAVMARVRAGR
jgi:hypothetical protein